MRRLLLLAFGLLLLGSAGQADPPATKPALPPAEMAKNGELVVTAGTVAGHRLPGACLELVIGNGDVAQVKVDPADPEALVIQGKNAGTSSLTVKLKDNTERIYTVIVEAPRLQVARRLRSGYIAYSVDLPKENTVGAILGLNDYVVVLFTRSTDEEKKTFVLMKNIRVVAAPAGTVILEVTTEEAKLLKSSQESGTLALGLIAEADLKDEKAIQDRKGERTPKK